MKLWQGRFSSPMSEDADVFNESLSFDKKLYRADVTASLAHAEMLGRCNIISVEESESIRNGLQSILNDIESGALEIQNAEDIHSFVEENLVKRIGDTGKKLHTARSRNDQIATDFRLYVRESCDKAISLLKGLVEVLVIRAKESARYLMPGFTHLRKAQPVSCGQYFNAYSEMFLRDLDRFTECRRRLNVMPLGSAALAGTSYPIDRDITCELLEFDRPCENSLDGVSDRDFVAEYLFDASLIMAHLSRLCEDVILYSTEEFGYFEISDAYSTGSSIMPQKKNPDIAELMRGKTGRIYGHLMAVLTMIKGLPLAYNKDLQEDKEGFFDAEKQVVNCLQIMAEMLGAISFKVKNMTAAAEGDFCCATDVADYLAKRGVPFRTAHSVTGKIVRDCISGGKTLQTMTAGEYRAYAPQFGDDITEVVKGKACADARKSYGGGSSDNVKAEIKSIKRRLKRYI